VFTVELKEIDLKDCRMCEDADNSELKVLPDHKFHRSKASDLLSTLYMSLIFLIFVGFASFVNRAV
jgi:hypothetical protein